MKRLDNALEPPPKRKFVFIPDGPFEFPQKLALLTGCSALEALSDLNREGVKGDWPPGRCSFEHRRLTKGCKASWSFEVQPESCQMQLQAARNARDGLKTGENGRKRLKRPVSEGLPGQVIFFEEVEGCPPVCHEVFPAQAVSGQVSGHCGPLGVKGLLWFTWQNDSAWIEADDMTCRCSCMAFDLYILYTNALITLNLIYIFCHYIVYICYIYPKICVHICR